MNTILASNTRMEFNAPHSLLEELFLAPNVCILYSKANYSSINKSIDTEVDYFTESAYIRFLIDKITYSYNLIAICFQSFWERR